MKKVLILSTHRKGGGAFIAADNLARALNQKSDDYQVDVLSLDVDKSLIDKLYYYCSIIIDRSIKLLSSLKKSGNLIFHSTGLIGKYTAAKIDAKGYDILNVHWVSNGLISLYQLQKLKTPFVMTFHDSWFACGFEHHPCNGTFSSSILDRVLFSLKRVVVLKAEALIFPSEWQRDVFRSRFNIDQKQTAIIPNCVFDVTPKGVTPIRCGVFKVGIMAQRALTNRAKGSDYLNEILLGLDNLNIDIEFLIAGKSSDNLSDIKEILKNVRISELGQLEHQEVSKFYQDIDVFLNLSLFENLSTTNIEAQMHAVPVICFDVGGNKETVIDGAGGAVVDFPNTDLVLRKLMNYLDNPEVHNEQKRLARKNFLDNFDSLNVLGKICRFWDSI